MADRQVRNIQAYPLIGKVKPDVTKWTKEQVQDQYERELAGRTLADSNITLLSNELSKRELVKGAEVKI